MRKFRKIFHPKTTISTTNKNENVHTPNSPETTLNNRTFTKQSSPSINNHLYTESPVTSTNPTQSNSISSGDDSLPSVQYAKMRIISSPVFQLRDIISALLTSIPPSCDLISTFITYGQSLGASTIHGYLVDRCYDTQTLINDDFSSYQGVALCITYDALLSEQQWEDVFGIHESTSIISKTASSFFHLTDFLCILSGSRVVYYDPNERMTNDERAYVSIFDLENDDIEIFQDQFSPLDYFLLKSKTFYNGTLIRLPLRKTSTTQITTHILTLDDIKQQILRYFHLNESFIELLLMQTNINLIEFDYTKDFQIFTKFLSIDKHSLTTIHDAQSTTQLIHMTLSKQTDDINTSNVTRWLLSIYNDYNENDKHEIQLKLLLPLMPLSSSSETYMSSNISRNYQSIQITSSRILYYCIIPSLNSLCQDNLCIQLRQIKFPQAYALFLKNLSRLINPTTTLNLSIDLIWQLMPDIDEYQRLLNENQNYSLQEQYLKIIYNLIPDIWSEIGKQELFYSVTDGWGYVAIEDMIINNVKAGPIQDVLTFVFSEANAPIVILPPHVINGLCKYSNKHYLQVMTPFHASELLAKNSSIFSHLTYEQKLSLLTYIILNDPDPGLVLELPLLPLANNQFITFQGKQASTIYIVDHNLDFLKLFQEKNYDKFLNANIDKKLFDILSSEIFQVCVEFFQFHMYRSNYYSRYGSTTQPTDNSRRSISASPSPYDRGNNE
ncbi:unnamed protein product [Rotaria sordida]|uniref:Sacsin/Nov domain-containing protein n=1 Tax=Rotaria sordida TaxID=392033 RepID=A0A813XPJ8_9BILA|nr:unnamed protein product [Rotaria sordida]CAF0871112.1 unnamed protein product [Rotaria sordida]CAF3517644.1 unnamed protein product [Rotaria sordida]CAF3532436.1 unnamed protein product [Rotaria sordida]